MRDSGSMGTKQFEIVCPAGVGEGDLIAVTDPAGGSFEVAIPPGISEGQAFLVEVALPAFDQEAFATEMQQVTDMDPSSVEMLTAVVQALHDDEEIDAFVNDNSVKFSEYDPSSEQSLEWGSLHIAYVSIVERCLESVLASRGSSAEAVYALLEQHSATERGQRFLSKFLSVGDYHVFCAMMKSWTMLEPLF